MLSDAELNDLAAALVCMSPLEGARFLTGGRLYASALAPPSQSALHLGAARAVVAAVAHAHVKGRPYWAHCPDHLRDSIDACSFRVICAGVDVPEAARVEYKAAVHKVALPIYTALFKRLTDWADGVTVVA